MRVSATAPGDIVHSLARPVVPLRSGLLAARIGVNAIVRQVFAVPLSPPAVRSHLHDRRAVFRGYRRGDGLWDIIYSCAGTRPQDGSIYLLRNCGTKDSPVFEPPVTLYCFGEPIKVGQRIVDWFVTGDILIHLGVTLFESVAGTLPFRGATVESLIAEICGPHRPRLRDAAAGVSSRFDAFVAKLMAPKPEDRPASAREALNLLDGLPFRERRDEERSDDDDDDEDEDEHEDGDEDGDEDGCGPVLYIVSGSLRGRRIRIPESGLALGRAMFGPDDCKASRFHARATLHGATLLLTDLDSMNGLIYRGKRRQKVRLATGESVTLGATTLVYHEKGI